MGGIQDRGRTSELYPELTGIYITGHGVKGVCQTLQKLGKDKTMHVIANDFLEENLKWLKEGDDQFPYRSGCGCTGTFSGDYFVPASL